jgi:hypothetical protein
MIANLSLNHLKCAINDIRLEDTSLSTTTGMKKKRQKVKRILNRNIKEGSPLEEDFLVALLQYLAKRFSLRTIL